MADPDPEFVQGIAQGAVRLVLKELLNTRDIPVCRTRIVRSGKGYPWNGRIALHPQADGIPHIKRIPD